MDISKATIYPHTTIPCSGSSRHIHIDEIRKTMTTLRVTLPINNLRTCDADIRLAWKAPTTRTIIRLTGYRETVIIVFHVVCPSCRSAPTSRRREQFADIDRRSTAMVVDQLFSLHNSRHICSSMHAILPPA